MIAGLLFEARCRRASFLRLGDSQSLAEFGSESLPPGAAGFRGFCARVPSSGRQYLGLRDLNFNGPFIQISKGVIYLVLCYI